MSSLRTTLDTQKTIQVILVFISRNGFQNKFILHLNYIEMNLFTQVVI